VIRSRSDELVNRIMGDRNVDAIVAKEIHMKTTVGSIAEELIRDSIPEESIEEFLRFCILVNKDDLQALASLNPTEWPNPPGVNEVHERRLLKYLGKIGVED
jgi:hypothetical protein